MVRKFSFRGKDLEELKKMDIKEFAKFLPSSLRRTLLRMGVQTRAFLRKFEKLKRGFKTQYRGMPILPSMVGMKFKVYNGKEFQEVEILPEMLGHRLGDFIFTTKLVKHSGPGVGATRGSKSVELK